MPDTPPVPSTAFRVGFVPGVMPDKWKRVWAERRRRELTLVRVEVERQERAIREGEVDMCLVRGALDREGIHLIPLYAEESVIVVGREHPAAAYEELPVAELSDDVDIVTANPGISTHDAFATVAAGTGHLVVPRSVARIHQRKDVTAVRATDVPESPVGLAWLIEADDEDKQAFIGIVRGRTARSSR